MISPLCYVSVHCKLEGGSALFIPHHFMALPSQHASGFPGKRRGAGKSGSTNYYNTFLDEMHIASSHISLTQASFMVLPKYWWRNDISFN